MPAMTILTSALNHRELERIVLSSQIHNLNSALLALKGTGKGRTRTGTISAAGRARIAAAQPKTLCELFAFKHSIPNQIFAGSKCGVSK
jgi:hypothetical protein